jgi:AcrR family transcriptional regulator
VRLDDIIATAAVVFRKKGYDAGTLDDVADELDLRRASIYHYVKSKNNLLFLVINRGLEQALAELRACEAISDPRARLAALIRQHIATLASEPDYLTVYYDNRLRLSPKNAAQMHQFEREYFDVFVVAVEEAAATGVLPDGVDARYAVHAIMGMTTWIYKWFNPRRDDPAAFAETCLSLIGMSDESKV